MRRAAKTWASAASGPRKRSLRVRPARTRARRQRGELGRLRIGGCLEHGGAPRHERGEGDGEPHERPTPRQDGVELRGHGPQDEPAGAEAHEADSLGKAALVGEPRGHRGDGHVVDPTDAEAGDDAVSGVGHIERRAPRGDGGTQEARREHGCPGKKRRRVPLSADQRSHGEAAQRERADGKRKDERHLRHGPFELDLERREQDGVGVDQAQKQQQGRGHRQEFVSLLVEHHHPLDAGLGAGLARTRESRTSKKRRGARRGRAPRAPMLPKGAKA